MNDNVHDIISYPVSMEPTGLIYCKHNSGVNCYDQTKCDKCGWNPEVSKMRAAKTRHRLETYKSGSGR